MLLSPDTKALLIAVLHYRISSFIIPLGLEATYKVHAICAPLPCNMKKVWHLTLTVFISDPTNPHAL